MAMLKIWIWVLELVTRPITIALQGKIILSLSVTIINGPVVKAQDWHRDKDDEVILIAQSTTVNSANSNHHLPCCVQPSSRRLTSHPSPETVRSQR